MSKEILTSTGRWWFDETLGIVRGDALRGAVITAAGARENLEAVRSLLPEGKRSPLLIDITKSKSLDREAREIYGSAESQRLYPALALLSKTPIGNIMA